MSKTQPPNPRSRVKPPLLAQARSWQGSFTQDLSARSSSLIPPLELVLSFPLQAASTRPLARRPFLCPPCRLQGSLPLARTHTRTGAHNGQELGPVRAPPSGCLRDERREDDLALARPLGRRTGETRTVRPLRSSLPLLLTARLGAPARPRGPVETAEGSRRSSSVREVSVVHRMLASNRLASLLRPSAPRFRQRGARVATPRARSGPQAPVRRFAKAKRLRSLAVLVLRGGLIRKGREHRRADAARACRLSGGSPGQGATLPCSRGQAVFAVGQGASRRGGGDCRAAGSAGMH